MFDEVDNFVEVLDKSERTCWNCDQLGHHWQDCLYDRTVFCYGCGAKQVYKPNCLKCNAKRQNSSKNLKSLGPQKDQ